MAQTHDARRASGTSADARASLLVTGVHPSLLVTFDDGDTSLNPVTAAPVPLRSSLPLPPNSDEPASPIRLPHGLIRLRGSGSPIRLRGSGPTDRWRPLDSGALVTAVRGILHLPPLDLTLRLPPWPFGLVRDSGVLSDPPTLTFHGTYTAEPPPPAFPEAFPDGPTRAALRITLNALYHYARTDRKNHPPATGRKHKRTDPFVRHDRDGEPTHVYLDYHRGRVANYIAIECARGPHSSLLLDRASHPIQLDCLSARWRSTLRHILHALLSVAGSACHEDDAVAALALLVADDFAQAHNLAAMGVITFGTPADSAGGPLDGYTDIRLDEASPFCSPFELDLDSPANPYPLQVDGIGQVIVAYGDDMVDVLIVVIRSPDRPSAEVALVVVVCAAEQPFNSNVALLHRW